MDSARLAGIMTLFGFGKEIKLGEYLKYVELIGPNGKSWSFELQPTRHPDYNNFKDFSRDQLIPLIAGLSKIGWTYTNDMTFAHMSVCPNGDLLSPSHLNHIRRCCGLKPTMYGNLWLKLDILYNAYIDPMAEPNQLICMLVIAGADYVRLWMKKNKKWEDAIRNYWSGWREEPELAEFMILKLKSKQA
ncbi:MAG: hypothetical protein ACXVB1_00115 [Pseudobdellovibrionaceae bacterium]